MTLSVLARAAALFSLAASFVGGGGSAFAFTTYPPGDYRLTQGVYGRDYWMSSPVVGTSLANEIYSAKWSWGNSMPGKVAWLSSSNYADSEMDWYRLTTITPNCAVTHWYNSAGNMVEDAQGNAAQNWVRATVSVDPEWNVAGTSCSNGRGVLVHEIGHVMGLKHEWPNVAIMRTDINVKGWQAPKLDDEDGIDFLYY